MPVCVPLSEYEMEDQHVHFTAVSIYGYIKLQVLPAKDEIEISRM